MTQPADFNRDVETGTKAVYSLWPQFCLRARAGFADKKRGTFLIDLDQPLAPVDDSPYLTTDEAAKVLGLQAGRNIAILSRVGTYNPEKEIVVTFFSVGRKQAQCVVLGAAPAPYKDIRIVTDRPVPTDATTFDELIQILNDLHSRSDLAEMDAPAQHLWRVMEAMWEIQSNGFDGYFSSVGPDCCKLLGAVNTIGSPVLQRVFADALARFPDGQPPSNDDEFYEQLSSITDSEPDAFEQHDSEFYAIDDQIPNILWAYWQNHHSKTA
jgi:hypothetical protein